MSKISSFLFLSLLVLLISCGGWSDDQKTQLRNTCIGADAYDCDCYVETIVKAHENPDDFNALSKDEKTELLATCEKEEDNADLEDLESF